MDGRNAAKLNFAEKRETSKAKIHEDMESTFFFI